MAGFVDRRSPACGVGCVPGDGEKAVWGWLWPPLYWTWSSTSLSELGASSLSRPSPQSGDDLPGDTEKTTGLQAKEAVR